MKRRVSLSLLLVLLCITFFNLDVNAQQIELSQTELKLDPVLRHLTFSSVNAERTAKFGLSEHFDQLIQLQQSASGPRVMVFMGIDSGLDLNSIPGFEPVTVLPSKSIVTGWLNLYELQSVVQISAIKKIEASTYSYLSNGEANRLTKVDQVHAGSGQLSKSYTGKGVVVGIIDSGIDFTAEDFSDENGTRIQFLMDMQADNTNKVWTKAEIDANPNSITQRDGSGAGGHGTHVAGTAVGNGRMDSRFKGVAPEADIIFVKGIREPNSNGGFGDADIIEAIRFIFEKAGEMGKPAVINMSLGGNSGPLDGSSLYEQSITELQQGPGKVIVAAAGNEGFDYLHSGIEVSSAEIDYFTLDLAQSESRFFKEIWYDPNVLESVVVRMYQDGLDGSLNMIGATNWVNMGEYNPDGFLLSDANANPIARVYVDAANTQDVNNGDGQIYISVQQANETVDLTLYKWGVFYNTGNGTGRFDATNYQARTTPNPVDMHGFTFLTGDRIRSVGSPSTAKEVVSVGAYVSTTSWTADNGGTYSSRYPSAFDYSTSYTPESGEIAYFSSRGPTRDGRQAPLIAAPGDQIFSVRSTHISDADLSESKLVGNGKYQGMQGTSMATPHVSGIIALMLQAKADLTYNDIVQAFSTYSSSDTQTGTVPNSIFGYGKIDALALVKSLDSRSLKTPI